MTSIISADLSNLELQSGETIQLSVRLSDSDTNSYSISNIEIYANEQIQGIFNLDIDCYDETENPPIITESYNYSINLNKNDFTTGDLLLYKSTVTPTNQTFNIETKFCNLCTTLEINDVDNPTLILFKINLLNI